MSHRLSFWHPLRVEQIRLRIDADIEADPKMMVPVFRKTTRRLKATRKLTKAMLISRFYVDDTQPDNDPGRTDKMHFYTCTTAKVAIPQY